MRTMITIDWDFFVPIDLMWDLSHKENPFFIKYMWGLSRAHLIGKMKTSGQEKNFWKWVKTWARLSDGRQDKFLLYVSESHAYAANLAGIHQVEKIISFDTHHDCWPVEKDGLVFCQDWLRVWLQSNPFGSATWVRPEKKNDFKLPTDIEGVTQKVFNPHGPLTLQRNKYEVVAVHVCRSGAWTAPWLDQKFIRFVQEIAKDSVTQRPIIQGADENVEATNPMELRWTDEDLKEAKRSHREMHKNLAKLRRLNAIAAAKTAEVE